MALLALHVFVLHINRKYRELLHNSCFGIHIDIFVYPFCSMQSIIVHENHILASLYSWNKHNECFGWCVMCVCGKTAILLLNNNMH